MVKWNRIIGFRSCRRAIRSGLEAPLCKFGRSAFKSYTGHAKRRYPKRSFAPNVGVVSTSGYVQPQARCILCSSIVSFEVDELMGGTRYRFLVTMLIVGVLVGWASPACARGTVRVQQSDGSAKIYKNVTVRVRGTEMRLISSDGKGEIVIGKAGCTQVGELLRCTAYDATLDQVGNSLQMPIRSGTIWLNPTAVAHPMTHSSAPLQPHGVLISMYTSAGTYISATGTYDELQK